MSGGSIQDANCSSLSNITKSYPIVPSIQFTDSCDVGDLSTSPKRVYSYSNNPFLLESGDENSSNQGPPSPLCPEMSKQLRHNRYCCHEQPVNKVKIVRPGRSLNAGFMPIKYGSAGDSNDELSGDSETETSTELTPTFHQHLHPYFNNNNLKNGVQFRRHSWIW